MYFAKDVDMHYYFLLSKQLFSCVFDSSQDVNQAPAHLTTRQTGLADMWWTETCGHLVLAAAVEVALVAAIVTVRPVQAVAAIW